MSPIRNAEGTEVVGTAATLEQDILPAGMHLPPCHSHPQHHTLPSGVLFSLPSALQIDLMLTGMLRRAQMKQRVQHHIVPIVLIYLYMFLCIS